ncbi:MAG: AAA family ATPase [Candidatus Loosdrechtia sp.]|uniref:YhaN family protein n=1 Tax=Candidatus Loosdrechtia sp. TaxID=3101272 RepID=UPI003A69C1DA|nr:MAG: AAA family ATPase [Candidatus Jettenia sp. AMX2]
MRIDRLDLLAYGPFTDQSLDLTGGNSGLHLIYGDNEAGKSTSLRALIAWLFGIPARTNDNFLHSNSQLRIGGQLRLADGSTLEFTRKKGNKDTLLKYGTNESLDDVSLVPFIPPSIDENLFTKLWGIDRERLIAGGRELLEQSGDLGQALFSAAVGTANLREVLTAMQNNADEIFKSRGSRSVLNQAIASYKEAQKRIKDATLPVSDWKRLQKDLSETKAAIEKIEKGIETKCKVKSRLERVNRVRGAIAQRRSVLEKIQALGQVYLLPEDCEEKRKAASSNLQAACETKERLEAKLLRLKGESESLNIRNDLLENEETILALHKELGAVEKTLKDRPQQDGKRRLLRNEAEIILKTVRPDVGMDQADDLRPLLNNKKRISGLAQKHSLLVQNKEQAESSIRDIEDERKSLQSALDNNTESDINLKELKAVIAAARKSGNLEQRLAGAQKQVSVGNEVCQDELARLGKFKGTVDSVLKLSLPVSATLDQFEKENDNLLEESKTTARKKLEAEDEKRQAEQDLKALLLQHDVPTLFDLETSRDVRNSGWRLIKRKYIEQTDVAESELSEYARDGDLPSTYEKKVESADHISDRLRMEADQVVKRAELESKIETLQSRIDDLLGNFENVKARQNDFQTRWSAIWEPLKTEAGTPREMKQWLLRVENLIEKIQTAKSYSTNEKNLAEECEQLKKSVSNQISKFDSSIETQGMSLESLISLCEQRVEEEEAVREKRRRIGHSLSESEIRLKRKQDELKSIEVELSGWTQEWGKAIEGLGLKADVHPEHAGETFDNLLSFFDKNDKSEELRKRIYGMDQVKEKFEEKVFGFADSIEYKREGLEASAIAAQLNNDLNSAREARASLTKIKDQLEEIKQEIEDADITIRNSKDQLAALRAQAKVETDEELVAAAEKSQNKRDLQKRLDMLEQELSRNGDGLSIEELEKEVEESEIDAIGGELEKVSGELKDLHGERDNLRDCRQTLQNEINAKDGSAIAANASEEAEQHLAGIASNAEQYLRLQTAALILKQRIENYRKTNQAPVLARAGELFSKLTLGSYVGLRDELDDSGKPILIGVRPDDQEVAVEGMSDGSRDQLYLSLRLATLEQHLSKGDPMPFVVDDILIGFDDNRTRVCLEVLAELASSTQVLLFTHHRRVIELAKPIDTKAGIFIHQISKENVTES